MNLYGGLVPMFNSVLVYFPAILDDLEIDGDVQMPRSWRFSLGVSVQCPVLFTRPFYKVSCEAS